MGVFNRYEKEIIATANNYRNDAQDEFESEYNHNPNFNSDRLIDDIDAELNDLPRLFYRIEMSAYTPELCKLNIRKLYEMMRYMFFPKLNSRTITAADNDVIEKITEIYNLYTATKKKLKLTYNRNDNAKIWLPKTPAIIAAFTYYKETFPADWVVNDGNIERYFNKHANSITKIIFLYLLCCDELHISATRVSDRIIIDTMKLEHIQVVLMILKIIAKISDDYKFNPLDLMLCFDSDNPDEAWSNINNITPDVYGKAEAHTLRLYTRTKLGHTEYAYFDIVPAVSLSEKMLREYNSLYNLYNSNNGGNGFGKPNYYINSTFAIIERSFCHKPLQLKDFLANEKLNIEQKFNLILKITEHISLIHESNIYHRLLTPEHILISYDNSNQLVVSILGFHGAKITYSNQQHPTVFYDIEPNFTKENEYVAPELHYAHIDDTDNINWEKCDAYSLGKIAQYIIFYGQENNENFHKTLVSSESNKSKLDLLNQLTDSTDSKLRPNLSEIVNKLKEQ